MKIVHYFVKINKFHPAEKSEKTGSSVVTDRVLKSFLTKKQYTIFFLNQYFFGGFNFIKI